MQRARGVLLKSCNNGFPTAPLRRGYGYDSQKTKALRKYKEQTKAIRKDYIAYVQQKVQTETKIKEEEHEQFLSKVKEYRERREQIKAHNFAMHQQYMAALQAEYDKIRELKNKKRQALEQLVAQTRQENVRRMIHESRYYITPENIDEHLAIQLDPNSSALSTIFKDQRRYTQEQFNRAFVLRADIEGGAESETSPIQLVPLSSPELAFYGEGPAFPQADEAAKEDTEELEDPQKQLIKSLEGVNEFDMRHRQMLESHDTEPMDNFLRANQHIAAPDSTLAGLSLEIKNISSALNSILMQDNAADSKSYKMVEGIKAAVVTTPVEDIMEDIQNSSEELIGADEAIDRAIEEYKKRRDLRRAQQPSDTPSF